MRAWRATGIMVMRRVFIGGWLGAVVLVGAGCGSDTTPVRSDGSSVDVAPDGRLDGATSDLGGSADRAPTPSDAGFATDGSADRLANADGGLVTVDASVAADASPQNEDTRPELPPIPVPALWTSVDIGNVAIAGGAGYTTDPAYYVKGSGTDVFGTADAFQFLYQKVSGNAEIVAHLASLEATSVDAKAGLMARESVAPDAKNAFMLSYPPASKSSRLQYRDNRVDSATYYLDLDPGPAAPPLWLRLVREGNQFSGYNSVDGESWRLQGQVSFAMASDFLLGLGVTSHANGDANVAIFDSLRVSGFAPPARPEEAWSLRPIGVMGSAAFGSEAKMVIDAAGKTISGSRDFFTYVFRTTQIIGDAQIVARISSFQYTSSTARAGLMFRSTLDGASSQFFFATHADSAKGLIMIRRMVDTGSSNTTNPPLPAPSQDAGAVDAAVVDAAGGMDTPGATDAAAAPQFVPVWLKLVRVGQRFSGYSSTDGEHWDLFADLTGVALASNAYVGLAVSAGADAVTSHAVIENIQITAPPPPQPAADGGVDGL